MPKQYTYTNQKQIRQAFREQYPDLDYHKITHYRGKGKMFCTDTRCAFAEFVDYLERSDSISEALAFRVTLD
jgi:hypothetical protein